MWCVFKTDVTKWRANNKFIGWFETMTTNQRPWLSMQEGFGVKITQTDDYLFLCSLSETSWNGFGLQSRWLVNSPKGLQAHRNIYSGNCCCGDPVCKTCMLQCCHQESLILSLSHSLSTVSLIQWFLNRTEELQCAAFRRKRFLFFYRLECLFM